MQYEVLESIRNSNEIRLARNREYVGGLIFLIACAMLEFAVAVGLLQAYVIPLGRCCRPLRSLKLTSFLFSVTNTVLYFGISALSGLTAFIVMTVLLLVLLIGLAILGAVRRYLAQKELESALVGAGATPNAGGEGAHDLEMVVSRPAFSSEKHITLHPTESNRSPSRTPKSDELLKSPDGKGSSLTVGGGPHRSSSLQRRSTARLSKRLEEEGAWHGCPEKLAPGHVRAMICVGAFFAITTIVAIIVGFGWHVRDYYVLVDGNPEVEFQPQLTAKALQVMYAFPELATKMKLQPYVKIMTDYCGKTNTKRLSGGDKKKKIKKNWIDTYSINMSMYVPQDYNQYDSINEWFIRSIDMSLRPPPASATAVVSPADCRLLIYQSATLVSIWLKGYAVTYQDILGGLEIDGSRRYFDGGTMVIARLAPQDYHWFHAPIGGRVVSITDVDGPYWSVSADAARSGNNVYLNERRVVVIDAGPHVGKIAYIGIGATCVGSVMLGTKTTRLSPGQYVERGEKLGYMQFGGSTVVILFSQGRVRFDENVIFRSRFPVETHVKVNDVIGYVR